MNLTRLEGKNDVQCLEFMKVSWTCLLFLSLSLGDCKRHEDPKPLTELKKLPPPTQTGKTTFGCLVNGKAMVIAATFQPSSEYQNGILSIRSGSMVGDGPLDYAVEMVITENGFTIQETFYPMTPPPSYKA